MLEEFAGSWSAWGPITAETRLIFQQALNDYVGVKYTPHLVSTQVVNGKNYRYKCLAQLPGQSEVVWEALVYIYKPINGPAYITQITQL